MKTVKIEIYGRVQGVFFRANTKKFCDENKIRGQAVNKEDGSVEITAQCPSERLEKLITWIKSNPGISRVDKVDFKFLSNNEKYIDFQIVKENPYLIDKKKALRNLGRNLLNGNI